MIKIKEKSFEKIYDDELLIVEAWGENSIRVRSFIDQNYINRENALSEKIENMKDINIFQDNNQTCIINGKIKCCLDHRNRLSFYNDKNELILKEYIRLRAVKHDDGSEDVSTIEITKDFNSTLKLKSREFSPNHNGSDFKVKTRFEADDEEKIYGMGQYQHKFLNLKGTMLELAQRNSQISIPFYISNKKYGFLWNNPGIGKVTFAKNLTEWEMYGTNYIDYWITVGENLKEITRQFTGVTGRSPSMPRELLGLWQSKLRYQTEEEVLNIVEEYEKRGIQLSTIAIDYFHWPKQGEYKFDEKYWPNPEEMVDILKNKYKVEPIISVWPTVQTDAENYNTYLENGYLIKVNKGIRMSMQIQGNTVFIDPTNEDAKKYVWSLIKNNYYDKGIRYFWLDVAEPGYSVYDFENYRYKLGTTYFCGNIYPNKYLEMIYEGIDKTKNSVVSLVRGAWLGAQKYGALVWSGDIDSSFRAFNNQVNTGLNMGIAGINWWTTDIGGFHGGNPKDDEFRELIVRWFQYSTFSPILRMHGDRLPHSKPISNTGGGQMPSGAGNEIWSYGEKVESILTKYLKIRDILKDYIFDLMEESKKLGYPLMRTLFYEYEEDKRAWDEKNIYLFGKEILVAPIMNYKAREREVYLPGNEIWIDIFTGQKYLAGNSYIIKANIDKIPIFIKEKDISKHEKLVCYIQENFRASNYE